VALTLPASPRWSSIAIACWAAGLGAGVLAFARVPALRRRAGWAAGVAQVGGAAGALLGAGLAAWLCEQLAAARPLGAAGLAELAVCAAATLPAAAGAGGLVVATVGGRGGAAIGRALAAAAAGGALGTVAPLLLLPALGVPWALVALGGVQAAAGLWSLAARSGGVEGRRRPRAAAAVALAALLAGGWLVASADLRPWSRQQGAREPVREIWGSRAAAVVARDPAGHLRLWVDRRHGLGGDLGEGFIERRLGHVPLLLHGRPRSVLALGVGTGNALGAVTLHGEIRRIEAAEGLGPVLRMLDLFSATNEQVWRDRRVRIHNVDAQVLLRREGERYDVIVGGPVHPWQAGSRGLLELDTLRLARTRLAPGGLLCLWVPLDELGAGDLAVVAATFLRAFGARGSVALLGHLGWRQPVLGLVAGTPGGSLTRDRLGRSLGSSPPAWAVETDLAQPEDLQALYVGGAAWLRAMAGGAPASTWDRPALEPRTVGTWWRGTEGLGERMLARVMARRGPVEEVAPGDEIASRRHRAVAALIDGELAEASGDLEGAVRGYLAASEADPTFQLPGVALSLLRGRLRREE
jgi:SAM-dependent methyltransferase